MCKVSDKLKLCTCKTKNVEQLKHYWVLYKYHKSELVMMGEYMLPQEFTIGIENNEYNYKKLEAMLNEGNCFDVDVPICNNDILELNFSCHIKSDTNEPISLIYEFVYNKNKWTANEYDPFNTDKLEKSKGKILNPFSAMQ